MKARRLSTGVALGLAVLAVACAKEEPPPGTGPDREAPRVIRLRPEYGASVPGFDGKASVRFDEPLSDPRNLTRNVTGSPAGLYRVQAGRRGLEIRPEDDWIAGAVYFIRLPAGATDLLRNRTDEPVEWLFRVGGTVPDTEVKGRLIDRVSGRGEPGGRLLFLSADSVPYTAVSDTGGTYRLPGLPAGDYLVVGFMDQNRNYRYDATFETGDTVSFEMAEGGRVADFEVVMLPADSTPPRVATAEAIDSVTIRVELDDPLDPEADLVPASVVVHDSTTGAVIAVDSFFVGRLEAGAGAELEGALEGGDEGEGEPEVAPGGEPELEEGQDLEPDFALDRELTDGGALGAGTTILPPAPTVVTIVLAEPLAGGVYEVELAGFANLRGLRGGGSARFEYAPPPPEPEAPAPDSVPADSVSTDSLESP